VRAYICVYVRACAAVACGVACAAAGPSPGEPNRCSMTERTFDSEASQRGTHVRSRESHTEPLCGPLVPRGTDLPATAPRPSEWLCGGLVGTSPACPTAVGMRLGFSGVEVLHSQETIGL
jgi:hypothetical protein